MQPSAGALSFGALSSLAIARHRPPPPASQHQFGGAQRGGAAPSTGGSTPEALKAVLGPFDALVLSAEERRYVALDCEMVGVGADGVRSALAQVVVVDWAGRVLYMRYVRPQEPVTDYRTHVSGIRPEHLVPGVAQDFHTVQREVAALLQGRILVGHGLDNDLKCLMLGHPRKAIRDTAKYRPFCYLKVNKWRPRRLKQLAATRLGLTIQEGEHEPAEDARAALALYRAVRIEWEAEAAGRPLPAVLEAEKQARKAAKAAKRQGGGASGAASQGAGGEASAGSKRPRGDDDGAGGSGAKQARTDGPHPAAGQKQLHGKAKWADRRNRSKGR